MAIIKRPPHDDGPVNAGEQRLLRFLSENLPDNFYIIPNCNIAITGPNMGHRTKRILRIE